MKRYIIKPDQAGQKSEAWASSHNQARELKSRLQEATGLKWIIKKADTSDHDSI